MRVKDNSLLRMSYAGLPLNWVGNNTGYLYKCLNYVPYFFNLSNSVINWFSRNTRGSTETESNRVGRGDSLS